MRSPCVRGGCRGRRRVHRRRGRSESTGSIPSSGPRTPNGAEAATGSGRSGVRALRRGSSFLVTVLAVLLEPLAVDLDVLLVLVVGVGELRLPRVRVRGHEELTVALGRVERG